ncbi:MAG: RNA-binding S4 domain-containing protein [Lachnospiraceae bacterium]|nr:RNA-binding S4 domain-containing protein [Lachnospiraceae bacterium]
MEKLKLREDYIKLGQAIKAAGFVESGVEAKFIIQDGFVKVNGEVEFQRGKKLIAGDTVEFDGNVLVIE